MDQFAADMGLNLTNLTNSATWQKHEAWKNRSCQNNHRTVKIRFLMAIDKGYQELFFNLEAIQIKTDIEFIINKIVKLFNIFNTVVFYIETKNSASFLSLIPKYSILLVIKTANRLLITVW